MSGKLVSEIMSTNVVPVREEDTLDKVFDLFEKAKVSGVPVMNADGAFVGVLSKTDLVGHKLVDKIREGRSLEQLSVKTFMNPTPPVTVMETDTLDWAIEMMSRRAVHRLFVTDKSGRILGVVSTFDVVKLMSRIFMAYL